MGKAERAHRWLVLMSYIPVVLCRLVSESANRCCEYCRLPEWEKCASTPGDTRDECPNLADTVNALSQAQSRFPTHEIALPI